MRGVERIQVARGKAGQEMAERLRLRSEDDVFIHTRRYLANGRPVEIATSYIPLAFAEGTKIEEHDTGPGGIGLRVPMSADRQPHLPRSRVLAYRTHR